MHMLFQPFQYGLRPIEKVHEPNQQHKKRYQPEMVDPYNVIEHNLRFFKYTVTGKDSLQVVYYFMEKNLNFKCAAQSDNVCNCILATCTLISHVNCGGAVALWSGWLDGVVQDKALVVVIMLCSWSRHRWHCLSLPRWRGTSIPSG